LSAFTERDYEALEAIVSRFQVVATTPNVLTEVSNLCQNLDGQDKNRYLTEIANHVNLINEEYVPSRTVISSTAFCQFGLSDAVLTEIAVRQLLVVTADAPLYHFLLHLSLPTVNFNHIRTSFWEDS